MNEPRPPTPLRAVAPLPIDARDVIVPIDVALDEIRAGRMVVLVVVRPGHVFPLRARTGSLRGRSEGVAGS